LEGFSNNLLKLKQLTIDSSHDKRNMDERNLHSIKSKITSLEDDNGRGYLSVDAKSHLINLDIERDRILKEGEETWRQEGDENTKLYHQYAHGH